MIVDAPIVEQFNVDALIVVLPSVRMVAVGDTFNVLIFPVEQLMVVLPSVLIVAVGDTFKILMLLVLLFSVITFPVSLFATHALWVEILVVEQLIVVAPSVPIVPVETDNVLIFALLLTFRFPS